MFDVEDFVDGCRSALAERERAPLAIKEHIERAVSSPAEIEAAVGDLSAVDAFTMWHRSPELTVLHVVWPPAVDLFAHDHRMWAAIGLYGGREDNHFFARTPTGSVETRGQPTTLRAGDTIALGADAIHAVTNPGREWTGSIHVYGGDYFTPGRHMWPDPDQGPVPFDARAVAATLDGAAERARTSR